MNNGVKANERSNKGSKAVWAKQFDSIRAKLDNVETKNTQIIDQIHNAYQVNRQKSKTPEPKPFFNRGNTRSFQEFGFVEQSMPYSEENTCSGIRNSGPFGQRPLVHPKMGVQSRPQQRYFEQRSVDPPQPFPHFYSKITPNAPHGRNRREVSPHRTHYRLQANQDYMRMPSEAIEGHWQRRNTQTTEMQSYYERVIQQKDIQIHRLACLTSRMTFFERSMEMAIEDKLQNFMEDTVVMGMHLIQKKLIKYDRRLKQIADRLEQKLSELRSANTINNDTVTEENGSNEGERKRRNSVFDVASKKSGPVGSASSRKGSNKPSHERIIADLEEKLAKQHQKYKLLIATMEQERQINERESRFQQSQQSLHQVESKISIEARVQDNSNDELLQCKNQLALAKVSLLKAQEQRMGIEKEKNEIRKNEEERKVIDLKKGLEELQRKKELKKSEQRRRQLEGQLQRLQKQAEKANMELVERNINAVELQNALKRVQNRLRQLQSEILLKDEKLKNFEMILGKDVGMNEEDRLFLESLPESMEQLKMSAAVDREDLELEVKRSKQLQARIISLEQGLQSKRLLEEQLKSSYMQLQQSHQRLLQTHKMSEQEWEANAQDFRKNGRQMQQNAINQQKILYQKQGELRTIQENMRSLREDFNKLQQQKIILEGEKVEREKTQREREEREREEREREEREKAEKVKESQKERTKKVLDSSSRLSVDSESSKQSNPFSEKFMTTSLKPVGAQDARIEEYEGTISYLTETIKKMQETMKLFESDKSKQELVEMISGLQTELALSRSSGAKTNELMKHMIEAFKEEAPDTKGERYAFRMEQILFFQKATEYIASLKKLIDERDIRIAALEKMKDKDSSFGEQSIGEFSYQPEEEEYTAEEVEQLRKRTLMIIEENALLAHQIALMQSQMAESEEEKGELIGIKELLKEEIKKLGKENAQLKEEHTRMEGLMAQVSKGDIGGELKRWLEVWEGRKKRI